MTSVTAPHGAPGSGLLRLGAALRAIPRRRRRALERQLRLSVERDALTGLWTRRRFEGLVAAELERSRRRPGRPVALLLLDVDDFGRVNGSLGHAAGDELLRHLAGVITAVVGSLGEVARCGGDEFGVVLPDAGPVDAEDLADRVLGRVRTERWGEVARVSVSVGAAVHDGFRAAGPGDLLTAAGVALGEAKAAGRDRAAFFGGPDGGRMWVDELRTALDEGRLVLYAQPIVPFGGGPSREELLVRILDPDGAVVAPSAFVPAAEQSGLICRIDRWVVERAVELARAGRAVDVNLSAASLGDPAIRRTVERAVAGGVDPALLTFEVTETAVSRNLPAACGFAATLATLGCRFALDDFGTGFGAYTYLKHLPVSEVKIDMSFVRDLAREAGSERVVRAIVSSARELGHETVAEGVEDQQTLDLLGVLGVDHAQGFHIRRPAPAEPRDSPGAALGVA